MFLLLVVIFTPMGFAWNPAEVLTQNFFKNLQADPKVGNQLNDASKLFIDQQVDNYISLLTSSKENHQRKSRKGRSLAEGLLRGLSGTYLLESVRPGVRVPATFPEDIALFQQGNQWYAAVLESSSAKTMGGDTLVVYTYEEGMRVASTTVNKATKLSTVSVGRATLIAVAENTTSKPEFHDKSGIYKFHVDEYLEKIQSLDMHHASDTAFWKLHDEIYLAIANGMARDQNGQWNYQMTVPIYKWKGSHFDFVQELPGQGSRKVATFSEGTTNFLAVANMRNNQGETKIYSEIYKYDYHTEAYEIYQRILTSACTDIKFFSLAQNDEDNKDYFMVVANSYETDPIFTYETDSIIYKLVEGYFIPFQSFQLNGVQEWLPAQGPKNEFVLFASTLEGLKTYQYDGWTFTETHQHFEVSRFFGVESMKSYVINGTMNLVVANKNIGNGNNVFQLDFEHTNILEEIEDEMLSWCRGRSEDLDNLNLVGRSERADNLEDIQNPVETLDSLSGMLDILEVKIENTLESPKAKIIDRPILAEKVVFNNEVLFNNLNAATMNNRNTHDLGILNTEDGFNVENIHFDSLELENQALPETINGHESHQLLKDDKATLEHLIVNGTVFLPSGMIVGRVNGLKVDDQHLVISGKQQFWPKAWANKTEIENLRSPNLNGLNLKSLFLPKPSVEVKRIGNLTVRNFLSGGYINEVDVPSLDKHVLKKFGNQTITGDYKFDEIEGFDLQPNDLPGRLFVPIAGTDKSYRLNQVFFKNDVHINKLFVSKNLNHINVSKDGVLDVLLKDSTKPQVLWNKTFENIEILNPINLDGRINSRQVDLINPLVTIDGDLDLNGTYTITGNVTLKELLKVANVVTLDGNYSLRNLNADGVLLNATEIKPKLSFIETVVAEEIFADKINGMEPQNFVNVNSEETQIIQGHKTFLGDVFITGATRVTTINGINVADMESDYMTIDTDQTIISPHLIFQAKAPAINSNNTIFDGKPLQSLISNQTIPDPLIINDDLTVDILITENLKVGGLFNGTNFTRTVRDTVTTKSNDQIITGHKSFKNLTIHSMTSPNGLAVVNDEIRLNRSMLFPEIQVENLHFTETCNGIEARQLAEAEMDRGGFVIGGELEFDTVTIMGKAHIHSGKINDVALKEIVEDTVKLDEPHDFDSPVIEIIESKVPVKLNGQIEGVDLDNLVLSHSDLEQVILGAKTFMSNVTVDGKVTFEENINGKFNMSSFCDFAMGTGNMKNLIVEGNAYFAKGPEVKQINGFEVKDLLDRAWFTDENSTLSGYVEFKNVIFERDIFVKGFVDNVSLTHLSENYFSRTRDQEIPAKFHISGAAGDVRFKSNLSVPEIVYGTSPGSINGIKLKELVATALIDDYDQVFETTPYFENCNVLDLQGEFSVNKLNLETDVMRYDKKNVVIAPKTVQNLSAKNLYFTKHIKAQDVDILDWLERAVRKSGTYRITGAKSFLQNVSFVQDFSLSGRLNGKKFDSQSIMLRDEPQDITGTKTFLSRVNFKGMKLKGTLNDVDISNLIKNQAFKNKDNVFYTPVNFKSNIKTKNLVIKKNYRGINVSELITNMTNLNVLNNLHKRFNYLLEMSKELEVSIKNQAHFVHDYKIFMEMDRVKRSFKFHDTLGVVNDQFMIVLYPWNGTNFDTLNYLQGHPELSYVEEVLLGRYLYIEQNDGTGRFVAFKEHPEVTLFTMPTNGTKATTSFVLPSTKEVCTLFIYATESSAIVCEHDHVGEFRTLQISLWPGASQAATITIGNTLYMAVTHAVLDGGHDGMKSHTDILRYNKINETFDIHQTAFADIAPKSVATVSYGDHHFVAVALGRLENSMFAGRVEIRDFDGSKFSPWQSLEVDDPVQVEFAVLPSSELILYVLTDNPTEPLVIYRYEGISGFNRLTVAATLTKSQHLNQFNVGGNSHFVVTQHAEGISIIKAIFKGEKI